MHSNQQNSAFKVPQFLSELVDASEIRDGVYATVRSCNKLFHDPRGGPVFFPEYTDHGMPHAQRVLDACAYLITEPAKKHMTSEDAIVLVAGTLLHDAAMHLSKEGFVALLEWDESPLAGTPFHAADWSVLWRAYCTEASRWDDRKLKELFDSDHVALEAHASSFDRVACPVEDMADPIDWSQKDCMFIGEFIRRHHPRMAHEFALNGMPTKNDQGPFRLAQLASAQLNDLAGLLAHSHGLALRDTFPYLQEKYHGRVTCHQCHVVYLMALLRIGDYLQIDAGRAPSDSSRISSIRSPISRAEWAVHQAIEETRSDESDTEAIFVLARPKGVATYLKVRSLLDGLQQELDQSWAVLGEVYSRQNKLAALGLRLRRLRSNIYHTDFAQKVSYVPQKIYFDSAGADLLKNLVRPLYEDSVEVGIRELVQNAIDAVNELDHVREKHSHLLRDVTPISPEVSVRLEKADQGECSVTVEDYGIGMDCETLRSYFLRAGASFRDCEAWRRVFTEHGDPQIVRSGRFGIGVLAAFLLGDRVEVTTRSALCPSNRGVQFTSGIDDDAIELRWISRAQQGTKIRITIEAATYQELTENDGLEWDWYRWPSPRVERSIEGTTHLPELTRIPEPGAALPYIWHRLKHDEFDDVIWTYGKAPRLICNGLNIGNLASSYGHRRQLHWHDDIHDDHHRIPLAVPSISVCDRRAKLPINLQRFDLANHLYPFADELLAEVTKDFIAYCLVFAPTRTQKVRGDIIPDVPFKYPGERGTRGASLASASPWFYSNIGTGYRHLANLRTLTLDTAKVLVRLEPSRDFPSIQLTMREAAFYFDLERVFGSISPASLSMAVAQLLGLITHRPTLSVDFYTQNRSSRVFTPPVIGSGLLQEAEVPQYSFRNVAAQMLSRQSQEGGPGDIVVLSTQGEQLNSTLTLPGAIANGVAASHFIYAEVNEPRVDLDVKGVFAQTWNTYMSDPIIPFDMESRRAKFALTYDRLEEFIKKWERLQSSNRYELAELFAKTSQGGTNLRL